MTNLKQTLLMFCVFGIPGSATFAHSGANHMTLTEGIVHYISSPTHIVSVIVVVFALIGLKNYRLQR